MPVYECGSCGERFRKKQRFTEHKEDCSGASADTVFNDLTSTISSIDISLHPRDVRKKLTKRNIGIAFGILMMATLFMGTAQFMTSTAPGQGPTGAAVAESNPATGYSIRSARDIPNLRGGQRPGLVSDQPLSVDQQLYTLVRGGPQGAPAVILHYNCETACPDLVNDLTTFAQNYAGWVYVAPNPDTASRVVLTAFQQPVQRFDEFNQDELHGMVCGFYARAQIQGPISCVTG